MIQEPVTITGERFTVRVGPEPPVVQWFQTSYFVIPEAARVAFLGDLMQAVSRVVRAHGVAQVGGMSGPWGDDAR